MPTANIELRDSGIRHAFYLQRYTKTELAQVIATLDAAQAEIMEKLRTTKGPWTLDWLERYRKELARMTADATAAMRGKLEAGMRDQLDHELKIAGKELAGLPVRIANATVDPNVVWAAVVSLPADRGHTLGELIDSYDAGMQNLIVGELRRGIVEGETVDQVIRRLRGTKANNYSDGLLSITRAGAERIVRTGIMHTMNTAREELYRQNADLLKGVQYVATLDTGTCIVCGELDGKVYPLQEARPHPPMHPNCRCIYVPVTKSWEELGSKIKAGEVEGARASMDGQVPGKVSYEKWLRDQPAHIQDGALGPGRAALFRQGKPLADMVDRGRPLTLKELRGLEGVGEPPAPKTPEELHAEKLGRLDRCGSLGELKTWARDEIGLEFDYRPDFHVETSREAIKALADFRFKYPSLGERLQALRPYSKAPGGSKGMNVYAAMARDRRTCYLGDSWATRSPSDWKLALDHDASTNWHPKGVDPSIRGVWAHELGHDLENAINQGPARSLMPSYYQAWGDRPGSSSIGLLSSALEVYNKPTKSGWNVFVEKNLSTYATHSSEKISEAFAAWAAPRGGGAPVPANDYQRGLFNFFEDYFAGKFKAVSGLQAGRDPYDVTHYSGLKNRAQAQGNAAEAAKFDAMLKAAQAEVAAQEAEARAAAMRYFPWSAGWGQFFTKGGQP